VVFEPDDEMPLLGPVHATAFEVVKVVPTLLVEGFRHHGRPEQVTHLAARHSHLELVYRAPLQVVALLDVHPIDAAAKQSRGGHEPEGHETENRAIHSDLASMVALWPIGHTSGVRLTHAHLLRRPLVSQTPGHA